jgi:hypothetical protein
LKQQLVRDEFGIVAAQTGSPEPARAWLGGVETLAPSGVLLSNAALSEPMVSGRAPP